MPSSSCALLESASANPGDPAALRPCLACGSAHATELYRGLVTCCTCGLIYFPRRLSPEQVRQLYGADYFQGQEYLNYLDDRPVHEANFRARARDLARWLPPGKKLFEIGCSYGFFLDVARRSWEVEGCDISPEPCRHAREQLGLNASCADFLDLPLQKGDADAFALWDTIEHLEDPEPYLGRIADLLAPGGLLALTTGDIGSWLARLQGPRWRRIHPPTHLWYFSRATMQRTLNRFGFEMVSFQHVGMARSIGQIVYGLTSLHKPRPALLYRLCVRSGLDKWTVALNTLDLMMVVARRRPA